ncbi:GH1 family beta-glucosidase [Cellulomonas sp.]|uniref:GH1 family beta-glucosidase n=1 Tax=Cellulomonas sp. TaxID=40001 RepID=UPI003BAB5C56
MTTLTFPDGFRWGTSTAAYQIEGAPDEDGKGPSIWDVYAHTPGKTRNGDTGDVALDHYHRYREDIGLIKDLGVSSYRFSVSWPRIQPEGSGRPEPRGLAFYSRVVDELLAAGIEPFVTLYHWDLPQALQDRGGWQSRDTAQAFAEYAGIVAEHLGDRVTHYFTLNEFQNFVDMGHQGVDVTVQGRTTRIELAPGLHLSNREVNQVAHHAVLAHGLGVQAVRAHGPQGVQIGPAEAMFCGVPAIETAENIRAAEIATRRINARFLDVMMTGQYLDSYLEEAGDDAPHFTDADMRVIASPVDFLGLNVYRPKCWVVASDDAAGYRELPMNVSHPRMYSSWHTLTPEVLYWAPKLADTLWSPERIYITENGCAAKDVVAEDGNVYDTDRVMYLRNGLTHLHRAVAEGVPIAGNFVWSAVDNLEWADGYGVRFGLIYVDFETQERIPKLSAQWLREAARRNSVV